MFHENTQTGFGVHQLRREIFFDITAFPVEHFGETTQVSRLTEEYDLLPGDSLVAAGWGVDCLGSIANLQQSPLGKAAGKAVGR